MDANLEAAKEEVEEVADDSPPLFDVDHGSEPWWRRVIQPDGPSRVVTTHMEWWRSDPGAASFTARAWNERTRAQLYAPDPTTDRWSWSVFCPAAAFLRCGEAATYAAASAAIRACPVWRADEDDADA